MPRFLLCRVTAGIWSRRPRASFSDRGRERAVLAPSIGTAHPRGTALQCIEVAIVEDMLGVREATAGAVDPRQLRVAAITMSTGAICRISENQSRNLVSAASSSSTS